MAVSAALIANLASRVISNHSKLIRDDDMARARKLPDAAEEKLFANTDVAAYARTYPSMPDRLHGIVDWLDRNLSAAGLAFMIERIDGAGAKFSNEWARRYTLTPAEIRLAVYLMHGGTVAGYAKQHGVSRNTARNQLQAVYCKTGTHRQAELVALLLKPAA